jgi:hypothetical protein
MGQQLERMSVGSKIWACGEKWGGGKDGSRRYMLSKLLFHYGLTEKLFAHPNYVSFNYII